MKFWEKAFAKLMETKEWKDFMQKGLMVPTYLTSAEAIKKLGPYVEKLDKDASELEVYKK